MIAIDARGHGDSGRNGGFSVRDVAADLAAIHDLLDLAPAQVVAISMGGPIAAHLCDLAPEAVRSLVIADSFAWQGAAGAARAEMIAGRIAASSMAAFGQDYAADTLAEDTDPAIAAELAASIGRMSPEAYLEAARSVFTADVREIMRAIKVPTLVVVGSRDQRTPPALSHAIVELIDGAGFAEIEGARHLANLDRPDGFHAAVEPFLSRHA